MTSIFMLASVLEVGLVVAAAVVFLSMIAVGVAVIIWFVAGLMSATHQDLASHH